MDPLVSVLIPVFNAENTAERAVRSILDNTLREIEIVLVDDGSDDGTSEVLADLQSCDPRVRLLRRPHLGIVQALNEGLRHCRAPIIARMDADDWSEPTRLERQLEVLHSDTTIDLVSCMIRIEREGSAPPNQGMARYAEWANCLLTSDEIARERFVECPIPHPTVMARRWLFEGGYRDGPLPEDYELWLRCLHRGARFMKVPEVLLCWTDLDRRLTRTDDRYSRAAFRRVKLEYLVAGPLADATEVIVWGAGPNGKLWLRDLREAGLTVPIVVEVDPRKIGKHIHGALAISPNELERHRTDQPILSAVGAPGGREWIRDWFAEHGLVETVDFWAIC